MTKKTNKLLIIFKSGERHSVDVSDSTLTNFIEAFSWSTTEFGFSGQTSQGGSFAVKFEAIDLWEVLT